MCLLPLVLLAAAVLAEVMELGALCSHTVPKISASRPAKPESMTTSRRWGGGDDGIRGEGRVRCGGVVVNVRSGGLQGRSQSRFVKEAANELQLSRQRPRRCLEELRQ